MKSILDRSFKYIPSHETDIRRTFERAQVGGLRRAVLAHRLRKIEHQPVDQAGPAAREERSHC